MEQFKKLNNIVGWIVFAIATATYLLTIEPTASWWDCGEFISTSYKLEVGHPPGAPLFMILARFFILFAFGNAAKAAIMVNILSALMSSFTILFLFWSITHIARKIPIILGNEVSGEMTMARTITILGAGAIGALAFSFTDSFWFNAVEGEVYASSSFFTAIVFWMALKWEEAADEKYGNRWLVLVAYFMGLSIGVHLLNLLTIPSIVFIYYFRKHEVTTKGMILWSALSIIILGFVQYGIIPGIPILATKFELLFVNGFGLPFNLGSVVFAILTIGLLAYGIYYTYKKGHALLNTVILFVTVIIIGYSSFAIVVIRSAADPVLDENSPDNAFNLLSYLDREQYGDRPLLYGQYFNAPVTKQDYGSETYTPLGKKYVVTDRKIEYSYDPRFETFFPRMYSSESSHIRAYKVWSNFVGVPLSVERNGNNETIRRPTFLENLRFFFSYQVGHMYIRYFMWNFAGKQNDIQGHGGFTKGNWISGIKFIDEWRLGPQDNLPDYLANNKGKNKYFLLPFLLGIIGLLYLYNVHKRYFWVVLLFFFFTGLAIILYLNQTPYQPRERDYSYAGSFYAFAMFIGFGVMSIVNYLAKKFNPQTTAIAVSFVCLLAVPCVMGAQNWDDHDRSGRYSVRDWASDYLNSCDENGMILTFGDNDTFPLWYCQEVEGIRTDVRVINMSLLGTDWYINQMKRRAYLSAPVPFTIPYEKYIQGTNDYLPVVEKMKESVDVQKVLDFILSDNPQTKLDYDDQKLSYIPTRHIRIPVDAEKVLAAGVVKKEDSAKIVKFIEVTLSKNYITKADFLIFDLLAHYDWKRPFYFASSAGHDEFMGLEEYFQLEGFAYRLVPIKTPITDDEVAGRVNYEKMYDNVMNKFKWGRMNAPDFFMDEHNLRNVSIMNPRENLSRLADALLDAGRRDSAIKVLDLVVDLTPADKMPMNYYNLGIISAYYKAKAYDKANKQVRQFALICKKELDYYLSLTKDYAASVDYEKRMDLHIMDQLVKLTEANKQDEMYKEVKAMMDNAVNKMQLQNPSSVQQNQDGE